MMIYSIFIGAAKSNVISGGDHSLEISGNNAFFMTDAHTEAVILLSKFKLACTQSYSMLFKI